MTSRVTAAREAEIADSSAHWEMLAQEAERMGAWERERMISGGHVQAHQAASYRAVVRANELELATGEPHCSCCFKPRGNTKPWWKS